jgi:peroxiredoxin
MSDSAGLAVGEQVPEFTGELVRPDESTERVALSDLVAEKPVLFNLYTADFSPDCVSEWCSFRDFDWFASGDDVQVVGVSKSGSAMHRRFIDYLDMPFSLYADPDLDIADAFGVTYRAFKLNSRARRSCFLVDGDRRVRYKWLADHWLDPTRDTPPVRDIHEAIVEELGDDVETFGMG